MKVAIVQIGNSRGVRLPKAVLEQVGFGTEADLTVEGGRVVLSPASAPRRGWAEAFTGDTSLNAEDQEWLDAPLVEDEP